MLVFSVKAGTINLNNQIFTGIYSGHPPSVNNPDDEKIVGQGPLPRGTYSLGIWHNEAHLGPNVCRLTMTKGNSFGRSAFFIHGDNAAANHSASDGCIIAGPAIREAIRDSGETEIAVI